MNDEEKLQAICDIAAARLANNPSEEWVRHDLKEIVRLTGKVWMLCRKHVTPGGRTCVKERGHNGPCVGC